MLLKTSSRSGMREKFDGVLQDEHGRQSMDREVPSKAGLFSSRLNTNWLLGRANSKQTNMLKVRHVQYDKILIKNLFLRRISVIDSWIHITPAKRASSGLSFKTSWGDVSVFSDGSSSLADGMGAGTQTHVIISPTGQLIAGSIMDQNTLKIPLVYPYGINKGYCDSKGSGCYGLINSPARSSNYPTVGLDGDPLISESHERGKLDSYPSRSSSSCEEPLSSSSCTSSTTVKHGMLQCMWNDGNQQFVFSSDDQKKLVYVGSLWKVEHEDGDDDVLDFMYLIHLISGSHKKLNPRNNESHLVGKMKVTTSFSLCPNNSRIMQREFILYGVNEDLVEEIETSSHRSNGFSKVSKMFTSKPSVKKRTPSSVFSEQIHDRDHKLNMAGAHLLEDHPAANLELAAVITKEHLPVFNQGEAGGWGLSFLKKSDAADFSATSSSFCACDHAECPTSIDILVPAGIHGGPTTRKDGPRGLIERWRSGGCCDCGGWDLGCPLTLLKLKPSKKEIFPHTDLQGDCKLISLFVQGSKNASLPVMRMVNVFDGLYYLHFQPTLSVLQSFSTAIAYLHTQNPALQSKNLQAFSFKHFNI